MRNINLLLKGISFGTGAYNPVTDFEVSPVAITLRTLTAHRKNYQPAYPVVIPNFAMGGYEHEMAGENGLTTFDEVLTTTPDVNTMNQVGLPADSSLVTVMTGALGTITFLANTNGG